MGMKKACSCGYWNEAQQECLYAGSACIRDDERKKSEVMEEWIGESHGKLMKFLQQACRQNSFAPNIKHKMLKLINASSDNIKDFIRSFVKEILGK